MTPGIKSELPGEKQLNTSIYSKEFIEWLDREIDIASSRAELEIRKIEPYFGYQGRVEGLEDAKEKYLQLYPLK